jgi:hypothetical protein
MSEHLKSNTGDEYQRLKWFVEMRV